MTYLPGSDEAIYPGEITTDLVIDADSANPVIDLTGLLYPLDGLLPQLARTLADVGLLDEFCALGRNRSSSRRAAQAIEALSGERQVGQVFQITRTFAQVDRLIDALIDVNYEPQPCAWPECSSYRTDGEHCAAHVEPDGDDDRAWSVA
jgi:hypothetical protein